MPGCSASFTMVRFSSAVQRLRCVEVMTSTRSIIIPFLGCSHRTKTKTTTYFGFLQCPVQTGATTFRIFSNHIKTRYKAEPGFITMNMPMLLDVLEDIGVENPIVCSNINKIGFRMCGWFEAYECALREKRFRTIAMSIFASGAIKPSEAIEWVCQQPNIEAIVFGASSRRNIRNTKELVSQHWFHRSDAVGEMVTDV